jgi:hypothetical protein
MIETTKIMLGPRGVQITLDRKQVNNGTPAIVTYCGRTATYWCAWEDSKVDGVELPLPVLEWIDSQYEEIMDFLYKML